MKRLIVYSTVLMVVALGAPALASAGTGTAKLSQTTIAVGNPAVLKVNVHTKFASVESVCFAFTFKNDLLDPGEFLRVTPLSLFPSLGGPAFFNFGSEPQATRTFCLVDPAFVSIFADGKEHKIELAMESGSVEIDHVDVTVTGSPR
jgi:hypothetical protein